MPIYLYKCEACGERFEALLFGQEKAKCPACASTALEKQFSSFAVGGADASEPGGCEPGGGG